METLKNEMIARIEAMSSKEMKQGLLDLEGREIDAAAQLVYELMLDALMARLGEAAFVAFCEELEAAGAAAAAAA